MSNYLLKIEQNDTLDNIIRKVNHNFHAIIANQKQNNNVSNRNERSKTNAAIDGAVGLIDIKLEEAKSELDGYINQVQQELTQKVESLAESIKLTVYPIGSVYITTKTDNPSEYFGGTWVQKDTPEESDMYIWERIG